ncbi:hypothetical protein C0213_00920 [Latilactobacillus sakei]|nr:hypothetical protein [Latilactobacillus sakei]AUX11060.1 hypothetical protein C0213_00920 [Latilactobacillus sakei]
MKMTLINSGLAVVAVISLAFIPMAMNRAPQQTAKVASVKQVKRTKAHYQNQYANQEKILTDAGALIDQKISINQKESSSMAQLAQLRQTKDDKTSTVMDNIRAIKEGQEAASDSDED